jgi:WD40 repeat protein
LKILTRRELPARPRMFAWSPDGNYIACSFYGDAPLILSRDGRAQAVQFAQARDVTCICWSPDSRVLAVSVRGSIYFWDRSRQSLLPPVLSHSVRSINALDWSADARLAAWADNQIVLYALPYASLMLPQISFTQILSTGAMRSGNLGVLRWSPDASLLVAGAGNGMIVGWQGKHLASAWSVAEVGQKVNGITWSPDGLLLAGAMRDNRVAIWDVPAKKMIRTWTKLPAMPRALSISPAGRVTVASTEKRLLLGFPEEAFPSMTLPGQFLAAWSPSRLELVASAENQETTLVLWRE